MKLKRKKVKSKYENGQGKVEQLRKKLQCKTYQK